MSMLSLVKTMQLTSHRKLGLWVYHYINYIMDLQDAPWPTGLPEFDVLELAYLVLDRDDEYAKTRLYSQKQRLIHYSSINRANDVIDSTLSPLLLLANYALKIGSPGHIAKSALGLAAFIDLGGGITAEDLDKRERFQEVIVQDLLRPSHATLPERYHPHTVRLAAQIYDDDDMEDRASLDVLADSIEDIGHYPQIITHLRDPKQRHWCGCWVIDDILRKD